MRNSLGESRRFQASTAYTPGTSENFLSRRYRRCAGGGSGESAINSAEKKQSLAAREAERRDRCVLRCSRGINEDFCSVGVAQARVWPASMEETPVSPSVAPPSGIRTPPSSRGRPPSSIGQPEPQTPSGKKSSALARSVAPAGIWFMPPATSGDQHGCGRDHTQESVDGAASSGRRSLARNGHGQRSSCPLCRAAPRIRGKCHLVRGVNRFFHEDGTVSEGMGHGDLAALANKSPLHREDGPAEMHGSPYFWPGRVAWWKHGKLHREDWPSRHTAQCPTASRLQCVLRQRCAPPPA